MFDGLWIIKFLSVNDLYGSGVLIINENRLLGGDDSYYYSGSCQINQKKIDGKVHVIKYDPNGISVFGEIDHFEITFSGNIDDNNLDVSGNITNSPESTINIVGTKKEDF